MSIETRWVARASVAQLAALQKNTPLGISSVVRTCIDAYRLLDAVGAALQGDAETARTTLAKIRTDRWLPKDTLQVLATAQHNRGLCDPFSNTMIAAYKQHHDLAYLLAPDAAPENVSKIAARHERYSQLQHLYLEKLYAE